MSPLPAWLVGAQNVALNFSYVDVALQLHYAMFKGSGGFVLKPREMREMEQPESDEIAEGLLLDDVLWPPPRQELHRISIEILSLHNLPKVSTPLDQN